MALDLCIRGGRVVTPGGVREVDVAVESGLVVGLGEGLGLAKQTLDASGLWVFPGMIDAHVHFNEPGRADWEGLASGSSALAAGGGTCFFDMPLNSDPPLLEGEAFDVKRALAEAKGVTDFGLWGGLTPTNVDELEALAERGVVGFKAFMCDSGIAAFGRADAATLERGMSVAAGLGLLVAVHAESEAMTASLSAAMRSSGHRDWEAFLESRPVAAELSAVDEALAIARRTGCRLHVVHVSHPSVVERIVAAREATGVDVSCETCPHYFLFDEDDLRRRGGALKCAPPLRSAEARGGMWEALLSGGIDWVGSDHSPCEPAMKRGDDAFGVWGGVAGVQSCLGALWSGEPALPAERVAALASGAVAGRFGLRHKGRIGEGMDADLVLVDLDETFELTPAMLKDRHGMNPYVGRRFRGVVRRTMVRGRTVFADGRVRGGGGGRLVRPGRDGDSDDG